jgi:hypothetical protein
MERIKRCSLICMFLQCPVKAHFHSGKNSTDRKFSENIIVKSWKFSTSKFFSDGKFVSANHILQNFLSAENFLEWKWTFKSWKFSTSKLFSDGKFVSANHILQNFLSAENFPEWKCALKVRLHFSAAISGAIFFFWCMWTSRWIVNVLSIFTIISCHLNIHNSSTCLHRSEGENRT